MRAWPTPSLALAMRCLAASSSGHGSGLRPTRKRPSACTEWEKESSEFKVPPRLCGSARENNGTLRKFELESVRVDGLISVTFGVPRSGLPCPATAKIAQWCAVRDWRRTGNLFTRPLAKPHHRPSQTALRLAGFRGSAPEAQISSCANLKASLLSRRWGRRWRGRLRRGLRGGR